MELLTLQVNEKRIDESLGAQAPQGCNPWLSSMRFFSFGGSERCEIPKGQPAKRAHRKGRKKALQAAAWEIVDRARSGVSSPACFAKDSLSYLCRCRGTQGNGAFL